MGKILDQAREVIKRIEENDQSPTVRITATAAAEPLPVTSSKFGGVPYLPAGVDAPANKEGQPLGMIAQINCAELPQNTITLSLGCSSSGLTRVMKKHSGVWTTPLPTVPKTATG